MRKEKEEKVRKEKEDARKEKEEKVKKEKEEKAKREKEEKARKEKEEVRKEKDEKAKREKEERIKKAKKEKEKEKEKDQERDKDKDKSKEKDKERGKDKEKERDRAKDKERERDRSREKDKQKDKEDREDKKKIAPKKHKRNELAALLESNDAFQMSYTSMYDRVKTQRHCAEQGSKSPRSSYDNFKEDRKKKGSNLKSPLYSFDDSASDVSGISDISDSEPVQKPKPTKEIKTKPKFVSDFSDISDSEPTPKPKPSKEIKVKTKQAKKKRVHLSSSSSSASSSSSGDDDDDALLSATKTKNKPTGKVSDIFSSDSDSEEEKFQSPKPSKTKSNSKKSGKPVTKRRKIRQDSTDSVTSREEFAKPHTLSSVTEPDSLDDSIDLSDDEAPKIKKRKMIKSADGSKRDSSMESVKKSDKTERDSSVESKKSSKGENKVKKDKKQESKHLDNEKKMSPEAKKIKPNSVKSPSTDENDKKRKKDDKKKKKKKYDPIEEEESVNSLINKIFDKEKKHKKKKSTLMDSESDDLASSETGMDISAPFSPKAKPIAKESKSEPSLAEKAKNKTSVSKTEAIKSPEIKNKDKKEKETDRKLESKKDSEKKVKKEVTPSKDPSEKKVSEKINNKQEDVKKEQGEKSVKTLSPKPSKEIKPEPEPVFVDITEKAAPKKKKKKDQDQDQDSDLEEEKEVSKMNNKSLEKKEQKSPIISKIKEKTPDKYSSDEMTSKPMSPEDDKLSSDKPKTKQAPPEDEFTSFWGVPKPILIPKRIRESQKGDDGKEKSSPDGSKGDKTPDSRDEQTDKKSTDDCKLPDMSPGMIKSPDSMTTPRPDSVASEDLVIPISEAETTVMTEYCPPASVMSTAQSEPLESEDAMTPIPDEMTLASSVEINDTDDQSPGLVIDEISESSSADKKKKKDNNKKVQKDKQEKAKNERVDDVIAQVAAGNGSDDEDVAKNSPIDLMIDSASNDQELLLDDVIKQQVKYDDKPELGKSGKQTKEIKDKLMSPNKDKPTISNSVFGPRIRNDSSGKKDAHLFFDILDEETKKKDEEHLKLLQNVLFEPLSKEELKKKEEEKKQKEAEEKRRAEEEEKARKEREALAEKARQEKEEQAMREASEEAERAVANLLDIPGFGADDMDLDDDLPPLFIENETKPSAEPIESSEKDKNELGISILSDPVPEKVSTTLEDSLLRKEDLEKIDLSKEIPPISGIDLLGKSKDPFRTIFTSPNHQSPAPSASPFSSPRWNSSSLTKDKTPEPILSTSPLKISQSPTKQAPSKSPQLHGHSPQKLSQSPQRPIQSPQRTMQSPQHHMQSPQMTSPRQMQSPQRQLPSPQQPHQPKTMQSPLNSMQSPQPLLQSPQRSPFFKDHSSKERSFLSPTRDISPVQNDMAHNHIDHLIQQRQRRPSFPHGPTQDQIPDPLLLSARRKSQEPSSGESSMRSPRRNTIAGPEDVKSIANLDMQGKPPAAGVMFKDRPHSQSSVPPPVSISLDNFHEKTFQSPMRNLPMPTQQQENLQPNQHKLPPPQGHFMKEPPHHIAMDQQPSLQSPRGQHEKNFPSSKEAFQEQFVKQLEQRTSADTTARLANKLRSPEHQLSNNKISPEQLIGNRNNKFTPEHQFGNNKMLSPEQLIGNKMLTGQLLSKLAPEQLLGNRAPSVHESLMRGGKGHNDAIVSLMQKAIPDKQTLSTEMGFSHKKVLPPSEPFSFTKELMGINKDPIFSQNRNNHLQSETNKPLPSKEVFSPKGLSPRYTENAIDSHIPCQPIDYLLSSPPHPNRSTPSTVFQGKPAELKSNDDLLSNDPLFKVISDPPAQRRQEGFPLSFYQEPIPPRRSSQDGQGKQPQPAPIEDDKKGGRKKRKSKESTKEDHAAALAKQQAIEESVQANVESIHKMLTASQQRAAAEKTGVTTMEKKKPIDAYDFDSQGQEPNNLPHIPAIIEPPVHLFDGKTRGGSRGRGRGATGAKRGRRGRGGGINHDSLSPRDNGLRTEPGFPPYHGHPQQPQIHQQAQTSSHLPPRPMSSEQGHQPAPYSQHSPAISQQPHLFGHNLHQPHTPQHNMHMQPASQQLQKIPAENTNPPHADWPQKAPIQIQQLQNQQKVDHLLDQESPPTTHQPQQQDHLIPAKSLSGKSDVLSPESKLDLDSSYGEPDLVINLDEGPGSMEGKENQYIQGSDTDDKSVQSPKRSTRARKPKDYRAIATGTTAGPGQPRASRSGGSPRGRPPAEGQSPKAANSPRTRSSDSTGSSPVVKLDRLEYGRTTRRSRGNLKEDVDDEADLTKSKDVYRFDDAEQEQPPPPQSQHQLQQQQQPPPQPPSQQQPQPQAQQTQPIQSPPIRQTRGRGRKKAAEVKSLEGPATELPESPMSLSNSSSGLVIENSKILSLPTAPAEEVVAPKNNKASALCNVDAIIDAVSKGNFGEDGKEEAPTTEQAPVRVTRQSGLRESQDKPGPETKAGRKGRTVPPLRIKKAGVEEKHYVIEQSESEKSSLGLKIKISNSSGSSSIKSPGANSVDKLGAKDLKDKSGNAAEPGPFSGISAEQEKFSSLQAAKKDEVMPVITTQSKDLCEISAAVSQISPNPPMTTSSSSASLAMKQGPQGLKQAWAKKHQDSNIRQGASSPHVPPSPLPSPSLIPRPPSAHSQQPIRDLSKDMALNEANKLRQYGFPQQSVPPAHSGQRPFMMHPDQQGGPPPPAHPLFPGTSKSPSLAHKPGNPDVTRAPSVTTANSLMYQVVSGQPASISPKSASPEGQVIERLPNPMRQQPGPTTSPFNRIHPDSQRFMKEDLATRQPDPALYQKIMLEQQQRVQIEALMQMQQAHNEELIRRGAPDPARSTPGAQGGKSTQPHTSQAGLQSKPLPFSDTDRSTLKSTSESPFPHYSKSAVEAGRIASAFITPSPGGHIEGIPPHMYPPDMAIRLPGGPFMPRLPMGMFPPGQQPPHHLLQQNFPPFVPAAGVRFPTGLEPQLLAEKKDLEAPAIHRSPSPRPAITGDMLHRRLPHEMHTRDTPLGILQRFPVMWQGILALKNDNSFVQMHFIAGNRRLPNQALPQPTPTGILAPLRISQRMRLEQTQLEGVHKRMACEEDYCILVAVACGRDSVDLNLQTRALQDGFITYLNQKQAAGIVNVPLPNSEQAGFVVHIFPPCSFVNDAVGARGSDRLQTQLTDVPHVVIIIATT